MAERLRAIWERLREDIHRNPGLWIGLGISAVILVIAYLAYRKNQLNTQPVVPANGYGIPDFGASSGGSSGGLTYPGYSPYQPASPSLPISPVSTPFTSPQTAFPAFPAFSLSSPVASNPVNSFSRIIGSIVDRGVNTPAQVDPVALAPVQNPTAAQTAQHRGTVSSLPNIQNPSAAQDIAHRGTVTPTAPTHYIIPTTIRPTTVTTRGRVA